MLGWFSNKQEELITVPLKILETDIHSHFIAGIDDGAPDLAVAVSLIKKMSSLGYKKAITTPHVMSDFYQNSSEDIMEGLKVLQRELIKESIDFQIDAAAEYYIDFAFEQKIGKEKFLTFGDNYILVELSFIEPIKNLFNIIFKLQLEGYNVVLAHPERYNYYTLDDYKQLRSRGVFFQINLLSLIGYYSSDIKLKTAKLIKEDLVSFAGSDCHNMHHAELYKECEKEVLWHDLVKRGTLLNHTL